MRPSVPSFGKETFDSVKPLVRKRGSLLRTFTLEVKPVVHTRKMCHWSLQRLGYKLKKGIWFTVF